MTTPNPPRRRHHYNEAAHKLETVDGNGGPGPAGKLRTRRTFNEAAHKLGYWAPPAVSAMIPPSPRLWARMMKPAYLIETTIISAQKINEATPDTFAAVI